MIRINIKNISIVCILSSIFFFCISCGGGSGTIEAVSVPSGDFQQFVNANQAVTPEQFCQWWNTSGNKDWKFSYYGQNGLVWPDNDTAEQIYQSKITNCFRVSKLLQSIYGGELVFVSQPDSEYDHYYLRLPDNSIIDNNGLILKYKVVK